MPLALLQANPLYVAQLRHGQGWHKPETKNISACDAPNEDFLDATCC